MKSLPKGLGIAILVGMLAGLTLGFFANSQSNHEQLIFHDGPSISIVTEKLDFELNEPEIDAMVNVASEEEIIDEEFVNITPNEESGEAIEAESDGPGY